MRTGAKRTGVKRDESGQSGGKLNRTVAKPSETAAKQQLDDSEAATNRRRIAKNNGDGTRIAAARAVAVAVVRSGRRVRPRGPPRAADAPRPRSRYLLFASAPELFAPPNNCVR